MKCSWLESFEDREFCFYGAFIFSKNNINFLLSNNGCAILLSDELRKQIEEQHLDEELKFKLVQHGLAYVPGKKMFRCEKKIEVKYFIIDLTKRCNFDCIYCFRSFKEKKSQSIEVLDDILLYITEYCMQHKLKQIGIQLWGGEPLLELDKIKYVVDYFYNLNIKVSIDIETNASLITDAIAKELFELGIHIGVSIDGPPEIQNRQRKLINGEVSSEYVERGIRCLQKYYGNNIGGIAVITKYNFRYIERMLDYFIYDIGLHHVKFNLIRDNVNAKEEKLSLLKEEIEFFIRNLLECLEVYHMIGADFVESNIELRIKNLLQRNGTSCCISQGCQGGKRMVSFDYKGDIYPCEMIDFPEEKIGSIYDSISLDYQIKESMKKNKFFLSKESEKCSKCSWWYYCRGGCSSRNRYLGNDGEIDEVECLQNNLIYPKIIEWILDRKII